MEILQDIKEESMFAEEQVPPEEYIHTPEPSFPQEKIDAVFKLTDSMRDHRKDTMAPELFGVPGERNSSENAVSENSGKLLGVKVVQLRKVNGTDKREAVLTDYDYMAPKQIYRGGNIEFMFEDRHLKEKLKKGLHKDLRGKLSEGMRSGTQPLADFIESVDPATEAGRKYLAQFQFDPKEIGADLRNIKEKLAESFVSFQKERYDALNDPGIDDEMARKEALSSLIRHIPEIAGSHARLQVMLQGTDSERDFASAALMEAWGNAMAQYRAEIDSEIASLNPEQLAKIADGMSSTYHDQFNKAKNDLGRQISDYQNDLGYIFMAAFCPPLLIIAAAPIYIPFMKAEVTKIKADSKRRKSQEQYKQIDERIEIAASITSARGVVDDWIESSLEGRLPAFLRDLAGGTESEYFNAVDKKNQDIKEVISPLLRASFEKKFECGSPEETEFRTECAKAAELIVKLDRDFEKECSGRKNKGSSYTENLKLIGQGVALGAEAPASAKILQLVQQNKASDADAEGGRSAGTSIFDVYKAYSSGELGSSSGSDGDMAKGQACALSRDEMKEYIKAKIASEGKFAETGGPDKKNTVLSAVGQRADLLDLDMQLRCLVSYDTMLTSRDSHKPKAGLDYLDAAFGLEYRKDLKDDTFWGKVEKSPEYADIRRRSGDDALENLQRLMIAASMAESYSVQLENIKDSNREKTYGAYILYEYYNNAKTDMNELKNRLGEDSLELFSGVCEKIAADSSRRANDFVPADYEAAEALSAEDAGEYRLKNLDVHLASEVAAITSAKHVSEVMDGMYGLENEEDIVKASRKGTSEFWNRYRKDVKAGKGEISMNDTETVRTFTALSLAANETSLCPGIEGLSRETVGMNVRHMEKMQGSAYDLKGPEESPPKPYSGYTPSYTPPGGPYDQDFGYEDEI